MQKDSPNDNLRLAGKRDAGGEWRFLRCGPLTAYFDPETAALRRVCLGETELVRAVYVAVRDHNWNTIAPQLTNVVLTEQDGGFHLTFSVRHRERDIDFVWRGEIIGEASGRIRFQMDGRTLSTFRRNRIGFCVLHPVPACVGKRCVVQTTDGNTKHGAFPDLISPHQPFQNMRSIRHEAAPNVWANVAFEGDVFEMEDQRNWTDASYKTYCTPLALPYPVLVPAETEIQQAVTIALVSNIVPGTEERTRLGGAARQTSFGREHETNAGGVAATAGANAEGRQTPVTLRFTEAPPRPLPRIGLGVASHGKPLSAHENKLLGQLRLSHLRLGLTLSDDAWQARLRQAHKEVSALHIGLEIALFVSDKAETELTSLANLVQTIQIRVARWIIFHVGEKVPRPQWVQMARQLLGSFTPDVPIGAGTDAYFVELNRQRPALDGLDCVSYSLNPQVHAFDDASLVENLQGQADTVRSAQAFCGDLPIVVSPVTLRPRFNPDATGNAAPPDPNELPFAVDTRQMSLFGAGWTLGSLKALCEAGVHSITYYETTGWRGVIETETGSPLAEEFSSGPGEVFPLYYVLRDIAIFAGGGWMLPIVSSDPLRIVSMALYAQPFFNVLCANLTSDAQLLEITLPPAINHLYVWMLDARQAELHRRHPEYAHKGHGGRPVKVRNNTATLDMPPYAYARLRLMLPGR